MEENNQNVEAKTVSKPAKTKNSKKEGKGLGAFINAHKAEFKKITWPTGKEVAKQTVIVIIVCLIVGAIIFGMDLVLNYAYRFIVNFVNNI